MHGFVEPNNCFPFLDDCSLLADFDGQAVFAVTLGGLEVFMPMYATPHRYVLQYTGVGSNDGQNAVRIEFVNPLLSSYHWNRAE